MNKIYWISLIGIIIFTSLFVIFSGLWFYYEIYYPSYLSYQGGCGIITEEEKNKLGYFTAGQVTLNKNETPKIELFVDDVTGEFTEHEMCHIKQFEENRFYSCSFAPGRIVNEMECYFR